METANPEPKPSLQNTLGSLAESYAKHQAGENIDPRQVAQDLTNLYQTLGPGYKKDPNLAIIFKECGPLATDPGTGQNLIHDPKILDLIYPPKHTFTRRAMLKALAGGAIAAGAGGAIFLAKEVADLKANGGPAPIKYDTGKLFPKDKPPAAKPVPQPQLPPTAPAIRPVAALIAEPIINPTAVPTEAPIAEPTTPELVDTFMEFLSPLIKAAQDKRLERLKNDPEYAKRIDPELNADRPLNIVIFGYGQTFEPPAADKVIIGSPTIISYNAKTKAFDQISLTHDIRAPEVERYLQSKGKTTNPIRIDQAYHIGGFDLMRRTLESATGLCVDFETSFQDSIIKDIVDQVFQGLLLDIPFDMDTQPFYQDDQKYGAGHFIAGQKTLSGIEVMQFMKALPQIYDKKLERNKRKHLVMKALLQNINTNKNKPGYILSALTFLTKESIISRRFDSDFDLRLLLNIATKIAGKTGGANAFTPTFDRSIYVVDSASGDGGIQWVTSSTEINPVSKHDLETGEYKDKAIEIPGDGNPHADNLITDYWKSLRDFLKQKLTE